MLRLFTSRYNDINPTRMAEYEECVRRNLACGEISEVCMLVEGEGVALPETSKIRVRPIQVRPTYTDYFRWINELAGEDDISLIANSDIWFDDHLKVFAAWKLPERTVLALSRWNLQPDGSSVLYDHNDSQDSWIVRGSIRDVTGDFPVGIPRCDNRIAAEFERAGYQVRNPSFSIRSFHVHAGNGRIYDATTPNRLIPPPYKYVWPHNLFGPLRTAIFYLAHHGTPMGYRVDHRRMARTLPFRIGRKLKSLVANPGKHRNPNSG
jgi:hypothetical protein